MLAHHLLRLLVAHLPVERIDDAIMRPSFTIAPAWLPQFIFFQLAHVFAQIGGALLVARLLALAVNILRDVTTPDALFLLLRGSLARDVADVRAGAPAASHAHLEHHAHRLNSPAISPTTRSTCCMASSRYAKKIDLDDPDTEQRVLDLALQMDECNCGNSEPHMHLAVEMPEGTNVSKDELQERVQKLFNEQIEKTIREREQAQKRRDFLGG